MELLYQDIMRHLELAEVVHKFSLYMLNSVKNDPATSIDQTADNRERVVNLLRDVQSQIEGQLENLKNDEAIYVVRAWHNDFVNLLQKTQNIDDALLELLEDQKVETRKEIGAVFTNHQKISAYNHSGSQR